MSTFKITNAYIIPGLQFQKGIDIEIIESIVLNHFNSNNDDTKEKLRSPSRKREYVEMRMIIFYFSYLYLKRYSLGSIGLKYNRDHATIIHALKTIKNLCETSKNFKREIFSINAEIKLHIRPMPKKTLDFEVTTSIKRNKAKPENYGIDD
jgi:chromosomal replication initiation ATPase DnaA